MKRDIMKHLIAVALSVLSYSAAAAQAPPSPTFTKVDDETRIYSSTTDRLFSAVGQAIAMKWTITASDRGIGTITFVTGGTNASPNGFQGSVLLTSEAEGRTKIHVKVQGRPGHALVQLGSKGGIRDDVFKALDKRLKELASEGNKRP
jgi:hypothetical protein